PPLRGGEDWDRPSGGLLIRLPLGSAGLVDNGLFSANSLGVFRRGDGWGEGWKGGGLGVSEDGGGWWWVVDCGSRMAGGGLHASNHDAFVPMKRSMCRRLRYSSGRPSGEAKIGIDLPVGSSSVSTSFRRIRRLPANFR